MFVLEDILLLFSRSILPNTCVFFYGMMIIHVVSTAKRVRYCRAILKVMTTIKTNPKDKSPDITLTGSLSSGDQGFPNLSHNKHAWCLNIVPVFLSEGINTLRNETDQYR